MSFHGAHDANTTRADKDEQRDAENYYTPKWVFDALGEYFDLDPCSPITPCPWIPADYFLNELDDGLATPWDPNHFVWMNPPYGNGIGNWFDKLAPHPGGGISLVFGRTDTAWFQDALKRATCICFISGRIQFWDETGKPKISKKRIDEAIAKGIDPTTLKPNSPGAPSVLIAYGERGARAVRRCGLGLVLDVPR